MARRKKIYEGRGKILYEGPEPGTIVQYFKDGESGTFDDDDDDDTVMHGGDDNGLTSDVSDINGKGVLNNRVNEFIMTGLNAVGIPTHFLRRLNMREQLVRSCDIVPLKVMVRSHAAGRFAKRLGMQDGERLPRPIVEYYLKGETAARPLVTDEHIAAFGWASQQEMDDIVSLSLRVNDFLSGLMHGVGIKMIDLRLEFGRTFEGDFHRIVVADEVGPNRCRLQDAKSGVEFGRGNGIRDGEINGFVEIAGRLGMIPNPITRPGRPTLVK